MVSKIRRDGELRFQMTADPRVILRRPVREHLPMNTRNSRHALRRAGLANSRYYPGSMPLDQGFMLHDPSADFIALFKTDFTGQTEVNPHEHA